MEQRQIKFRAWDKENNCWYPFDGGMWALNRKPIPILYSDLNKNIVLMQSTGLFDKNGKEIQEGDIVCHIEDVVVEVIEGHERMEPEGIFTEVKIPEIYSLVGDALPDVNELEIIGNIYENPDLLTHN